MRYTTVKHVSILVLVKSSFSFKTRLFFYENIMSDI